MNNKEIKEQRNDKTNKLLATETSKLNSSPALPKETKTNQDDLSPIDGNKKERLDIKKELEALIDAMDKNQSLLSRAARFWGELPTSYKIIIGVVLLVPLFVISIVAHIAVLLTISIFTFLNYTLGAVLLDNHHNTTKEDKKKLQDRVASLANILSKVIGDLDGFSQKLAINIDLVQKENGRLTTSIDQFCEQTKTLTSQVNELRDTEKVLRTAQIDLEHTSTTLKSSIEEQSKVLENTQKVLEQVVREYKENQNQLSNKTMELDDIKEKMRIEVEQAQAVVLILNGTVETLSNVVIQDKEQRVAFQKRLNEFLANKEKSFVEVADRICDAERKLSVVTKQLEQNNQRYSDLINKQTQQTIQLEQIIETYQSNQVPESNNGIKPSINGFYAIKKEPPFLTEPTHGAAMVAVV